MTPIDLRSDTVTRPTPAMRQAMAGAVVGDDQFGEDPTVRALQDRIAAMLGKAAALWCPTGTMANQVVLRALTRPGDEVIVSRESHAVWHEAGAGAANSSVQFTEIGTGGMFTPEELAAAIKPRGHMLYAPTTLIEVENTHNRAGGIVMPLEQTTAMCKVARERGIPTFLDGARLWNASVASGHSVEALAASFDMVSVALSKGLGAPGGSVLAGSVEFIASCHRHRRMLGGAMRQVGIFAAAGLHALDNHLERLADDHVHARLIAERLAPLRRVVLDLSSVCTNIVVFRLCEDGPDAATVVARAAEAGVLVVPFGPRTVRAVTHMDVSRDDCERGAAALARAIAAA